MSYNSIPAIVRKVNDYVDADHKAGDEARAEASAALSGSERSSDNIPADPRSDRE